MKTKLALLLLFIPFISCQPEYNEIDHELLEYVDFKEGSWWLYDVYYNNDTISTEKDCVYVISNRRYDEYYSSDRPVHEDETLEIKFQNNTTSFKGIAKTKGYEESYYPVWEYYRNFRLIIDHFQNEYLDTLLVNDQLFNDIIKVINIGQEYYYSKNIGVVESHTESIDTSFHYKINSYNINQ